MELSSIQIPNGIAPPEDAPLSRSLASVDLSNSPPLKSEMRLIVQCARTFLSPGESAALSSAVARVEDWHLVEQIAERHCLTPVVAFVLFQHAAAAVPGDVAQPFRQGALRLARNNLALAKEWLQLLQLFEDAELPVISLKGPALASTAYGDLAWREFHDLDLLIHSKDVRRARDILLHNGYELWSTTLNNSDTELLRSRNRQLCFTNAQHGAAIDLHWGALHEMFSFQLPADQLWKQARVEHWNDLSFLSLAPEHLLLYLCAHGSKHCWRNLCWLCDIAALVEAHPQMDWPECLRLAESSDSALLLQHTLLLTQQVLGLKVPEVVRSSASNDERALELAAIAYQFLFPTSGDSPRRLDALRYHLALTEHWRSRARLIVDRIFVPEEQDWKTVRLPNTLHFLYYLIRPVRFILERLSVRHRER